MHKLVKKSLILSASITLSIISVGCNEGYRSDDSGPRAVSHQTSSGHFARHGDTPVRELPPREDSGY